MWRGVSRHYLNYITSSRGWFFTAIWVIANQIGRPRLAYRVFAVCRKRRPRLRESIALFRGDLVGRELDFITRQNENKFLLQNVARRVYTYQYVFWR